YEAELPDFLAYSSVEYYFQFEHTYYTWHSPITAPDSFYTWHNATTNASEEKNITSRFELFQNYPNPFNPSTYISYAIPKSGLVQLKVFDINGKEIQTLVNESQNAGSHQVTFNGSPFSSGVYFYQLQFGKEVVVKKKMLYVK
ncbi:MAG: T9SS C-terminal target domain-containing protein, partial [Calditrichaeota bacterium]